MGGGDARKMQGNFWICRARPRARRGASNAIGAYLAGQSHYALGAGEVRDSAGNGFGLYSFSTIKWPIMKRNSARLPGARIINRYMPGTSLEARAKALQNLNDFLRTLLEIEERKCNDVEPHE